jgi:hypothetical protein
MSEKEAEPGAAHAREKVECFCMGTGPELYSIVRKFGPESAREHFRNARVEILKGFRELIDKRIEALSREEEKKGTKVAVE